MFDLEQAIIRWKNSLRKHRSFEDGDLAELEGHLRDKIDALMTAGMSAEEALAKAAAEFTRAEALDREYGKAAAARPRVSAALFGNYIKIALRKIWGQKSYSFINIAGLAIGIAGCLLIFLFVRHEWSYDRFHAKSDRLYRMAVFENYSKQEQFFNAVTPFPLGPALKENFSEVAGFVRVVEMSSIIGRGTVTFFERFHIVDPSFFDLFSFPLTRGTGIEALRDPGSIVLTESTARKFFGAEDPIGKVLFIRLNGKDRDFRVSAVAKDAPENSSIRFSYLISMDLSKDLWRPGALQSWFNVEPETYLELKAGSTGKSLEAKLEPISRIAMGADYKPGVYTIKAQPLTSIHLDKSYPSGIEPISDPAYSYILSGIALLVLILACLNFVTISIGRSSTRALEVGVRKAVGADRGQLMKQFWGEAILTTLFALIAGYGLARLALPTFRILSGKSLVLDFSPWTLLALFFILAATGLAAGFYPALVLSSFRPVDVLKGRIRIGRRTGLRRTLVVFQFVLSITLITSTLIMARQMGFLRTKDLGFHGEQVLVLRTNSPRAEGDRLLQAFRSEAASRPGVLTTAGAAYTFGEGWMRAGFTTEEGIYREFYMNIVNPEFLDALRISMAAGRNFSRDFPADIQGAVLINEAFAREFQMTSPVGKSLPGKRFPAHHIIGIIKDFHFQSLHDPIQPLVLVLDPANIRKGIENINTSSPGFIKIFIRISADNIPETMASIRSIWNRIAPTLPYDYSFLDGDLDLQYRRDEQWGRIVRYASQFAVLIACLGLFGLTSLVIAQRFKEIGIRKVLGSSAGRILSLLSWDFLKLVLLSNLLAWPLAYFAMSRWVRDFAYRIDIGPGSFFLAAALGALIAQATIGILALKAALADPVKAIRYE